MRRYFLGGVAISAGVANMLSLRMDAAHGTPTLWQKIAVRIGLGHAIGMNDAEIKSTLEGDNRDVTQAEQDLLALFSPILHAAEGTGLADAREFVTNVITSIGVPTSIAQVVKAVEGALTTEVGTAKTQLQSLGQTSFTTFVSAVLGALGHINLPAA